MSLAHVPRLIRLWRSAGRVRRPQLVRAVAAAVLWVTAALPQAQAAAVPGQGTWQADLVGRDLNGNLADGYEAYFDKALGVTWLADANYAKTVGFSGANAAGAMDWATAQSWASGLNIFGTTGWRLPGMVDLGKPGCDNGFYTYNGGDCGYNVATSQDELAHLFQVTLGNKARYSTAGVAQSGYGLSNTGSFKNVQSNVYWSGADDAADPTLAWWFSMANGLQDLSNKSNPQWVWLVHAGDIASTVPEPQMFVLMLVGLAVVRLVRSRHRA